MHTLKRVSLATLVALGLAACGGHDDKGAAAKAQARSVAARTLVLMPARLPDAHPSPAVVVAAERVEVASRLMGYIHDIAVKEGQAVGRGQRLFSVDPVDVQGQVEQARLALRLAEDAHADAKADYERYANLFKEEVISRQQFDKSKLQLDTATSRLAQAKAGLATASGQLRYAAVTAPIAGTVTRRLADPGDMAAPGQPVLVLENLARLQVETQVPETVFRALRLNDPVTVEVDGLSAPLQARVARLSPSADPVSHTFLVKLDAAGAGLRPGSFARVLFPLGEREVLRLPRTALVARAGIEGVFVVGADGIARFRMVRLGAALGEGVEVLAGLEKGERVVVDGAAKLESGDKVTG